MSKNMEKALYTRNREAAQWLDVQTLEPRAWVCISLLSPVSCVNFGRFLNFFLPQFPNL